ANELPAQFGGYPRSLDLDDTSLGAEVRVFDPVIKTAPPQGIMHLPGAIGGDDDDRRLCGLDGAKFRDAQLEVGEKLEEECLERFVGPIEFVDEQYRRSSGVGF